MATIEATLLGNDAARWALVVARFNELVTERLQAGAIGWLRRHGVEPAQIDTIHVPGAFELPLAAHKAATSGRYAAVVALGALIRGATPHFDYIAAAATQGLARVALETGVPVGYGLLTCDTIEQAIERAGTKAGNKGEEAAAAAFEMAALLQRLEAGT